MVKEDIKTDFDSRRQSLHRLMPSTWQISISFIIYFALIKRQILTNEISHDLATIYFQHENKGVARDLLAYLLA